MISILVLIVIFIAVFIWDTSLSSQLHKLYGECSGLLEELKKANIQSYEKFQKLYGKDLDIIGHRTPADFPISLYYNLKDISTLGFLKDRLIQIKMSWLDGTGKI